MDEKDLIRQAGELFSKYGIKSMTMDDVARQLGISKKTLYQFVENKRDLVKKAVNHQIEMEQNCMCNIFEEGGNAIDELMEITQFVGENMKEMHPSVLFDLKKYHMEAWNCLKDHKDKFIHDTIKKNIEKGIRDGLYRNNLTADIVARFYLCMVGTIIDPEMDLEEKYSKADLHAEMMRYHIRGIANDKGRKYLKEKFNVTDND